MLRSNVLDSIQIIWDTGLQLQTFLIFRFLTHDEDILDIRPTHTRVVNRPVYEPKEACPAQDAVCPVF